MSARPPDRGCAVRPGAQRGVAELPELGRRGGLIAGSCGRCAAGIATSLPGRGPLRTASRNHGETAAAPGDRTGGLTASGPTHGGLPPVRYPGYSPAPARRRNAAAGPARSAGFHAGAADGCRPRPARQDPRLRGLTARRHLTNVLSRIVPRWIASCFLPRTSGTKGGSLRGAERVRTLSPNEATDETGLSTPAGTCPSGCDRWGVAPGRDCGNAGVVGRAAGAGDTIIEGGTGVPDQSLSPCAALGGRG